MAALSETKMCNVNVLTMQSWVQQLELIRSVYINQGWENFKGFTPPGYIRDGTNKKNT